jgi:hypothetical protein
MFDEKKTEFKYLVPLGLVKRAKVSSCLRDLPGVMEAHTGIVETQSGMEKALPAK